MAGEVTYVPKEEDFLAAQRDWARSRSRSGKTGFVVFLVILTFGLLWIAGSNVPRLLAYEERAFDYAPYFVGAWASWMLFCALSYVLSPRLIRRTFRQRASLQRPVGYSWSEEGLGFWSSDTKGLIPWADLHGWAKGDRCFLFFLDERMFHYVPRSELDEGQARDLEATAAASGAPRLGVA